MKRVRATTKVLVLSDLHVPFQCEKSLAVVEAFKKDFKPDITLALGDWIDCHSVSSFAKDILEHDQLDEFEMTNDLLDRFEPDVFFCGNHEERMFRESIPQDYRRLLDPRKWLNLKKRGIKWVPYSSLEKHLYKIGKLTFIHGFSAALAAGKNEALRFGCVVHGHTHRIGIVQVPHASYKHTAFNIGCLCKLDLGYMANRQPHSWANGFGWGYIYKSGNFTFNVARLIGDKVHLSGKEYSI